METKGSLAKEVVSVYRAVHEALANGQVGTIRDLVSPLTHKELIAQALSWRNAGFARLDWRLAGGPYDTEGACTSLVKVSGDPG